MLKEIVEEEDKRYLDIIDNVSNGNIRVVIEKPSEDLFGPKDYCLGTLENEHIVIGLGRMIVPDDGSKPFHTMMGVRPFFDLEDAMKKVEDDKRFAKVLKKLIKETHG